jgi:hypothetical protein
LFLKEPVRLVYLLSLPLTLVGLFMIVGVNWYELEPSYRVGLYYGLAAAVFYAAVVSGIRQAARKGQAVSSPPQAVATSLLIKEDLRIFEVRRSVRLAYPDRDRETAVRYRGGSLKRVLRCRITFGVAVIVGNLVYHRVPISPEEAFVWRMAVGRPVPVTVLGTETVWRAIMITLVKFGLEAVHRTIVLAPGLISLAAVPVKFVNRRFSPSLKIAAAILVARADSFAVGP